MGAKGSSYSSNKITLKDIAVKTGFTINTVSRALKDKEDISETTREFIKETANDMGYIPNAIAGSLRSGVTKTIAVILGDISNPHFSILVKEIETSARRQNYNTFIINTDEKSEIEEEAIHSALGKNVDGIIICPTQKSENNIRYLKKTGVPFVLIGRYFKNINTDYVVCDDVNGGYFATRHLIERGHRRILFLNGPDYISSSIERHEGYKKALSENNIEYDSGLVHEISITSGESNKIISRIIKSDIKFTAIFAFSDMIAWETIHVLNRNGLRVPEDVAIVGFDNIQSKLQFPVLLTSISTSKSKMSKRAVEVLLKRINNIDTSEYIKTVIDTQIVIRGST